MHFRKSYIIILALALMACTACVNRLSALGSVSGFFQSPSSASVSGDPTGDAATPADTFVDSIGVNTHFTYSDTFYNSQWDSLSQLLIQSGIRHIRDGGVGADSTFYSRINYLYDQGGIRSITGLAQGDSSTLPAMVNSVISNMPHLEGFESLNEWDANGGAQWANYMQTYQPQLYAAVKANPLTANLPVIGPSLAESWEGSNLGDLSSALDFGNLHNYYAGRNPGSAGWGNDGYGSIPYNLTNAAIVADAKPIWTTETGYYTGSGVSGQSPDSINGRYLPRLFLEQFNAGIKRTYIYQFAAETVDPAGADGSSLFGMIDGSQQPKPEYTATKNLIGLLADPGATFLPGKLNFNIGGGDGTLHHALFQKHDGSFYLAFWIEAEGYSQYTFNFETVAPQNITITFATQPNSLTLSNFNDDGTIRTSTINNPAKAVSLIATDNLSILKITHP